MRGPKYQLILAYDGTDYSGWQIQPNGPSIQEKLQQVLQILTREAVHVTGAGRTDAGVHALGQSAHFTTQKSLDLYRIVYSLNGILPKEIRVLKCLSVPDAFHARYSAKGKIYHYHLHTDHVENPFTYPYRWHLHEKIDLSLLAVAAQLFVGEHDFSSFSNEADRGSASRDAVRTIDRIDVVIQPGGFRLEFMGNGFLYKMVRNIVGTLIEVASGKRLLSDIPRLLSIKDRRQAGRAAPAQGLFLMEVCYPEGYTEYLQMN